MAPLLAVMLVASACRLPRPNTEAVRVLEPQLVAVPPRMDPRPGAVPVRLLQVESRSHIARRVIRDGADGELTEDPVWRWASAPHVYLDTALRMAFSSTPDVRLVDASEATTLTVTLLAWQLAGTGPSPSLSARAEVTIVGRDRVVRTHVVEDREPVSAELPGTLAAASGRLLQRLASSSVALVTTPEGAVAPRR